MTSSCDGLDGYSFGLVNVREIDKLESGMDISSNLDSGRLFEFYGGEDQFSLSPDCGVFSIYHKGAGDSVVGVKSSGLASGLELGLDELSLRGFTEGKFITDSEPPDPEIRMRRSVNFSNVVGTKFNFDVSRIVRLMELDEIAEIFGHSVAVSLEQIDASYVAYQTSNTIVNRGDTLIKDCGLVSIKIKSMLNTGVDSVAIIPFREGQEIELGPSFGVDFFDLAPHSQLRKLPQAVLLRADSKRRCQVGISRSRAMSFLGSVDFRDGNLTLISFNLPKYARDCDYLSNAFFETEVIKEDEGGDDFPSGSGVDFVSTRNNEVYQRNGEIVKKIERELGRGIKREKTSNDNIDFNSMYSGEVVRVYNRGVDIDKSDEDMSSRYCEFDVFSSAHELSRGEVLSHHQHTLHINADNQTLSFIVNESLGVNYEKTYEKILR
jgi:hypothetical protein